MDKKRLDSTSMNHTVKTSLKSAQHVLEELISERLLERVAMQGALTHEMGSLKTTVATLKLKGIDGGLHKRWSMWSCMAVVSSWRELSG
eukprot:29642-Pelagococcus_subviridis.AAC.3